jgi:hypothetical protein
MAVGTQEHALTQLLSDLLPASRVASAGDPEVLLVGAEVVELQRVDTPTVTTHLTPTALFRERLSAHFASPALDGLDQVQASISVRPIIRHPFTPLLQPLALPVELPGNEVAPF